MGLSLSQNYHLRRCEPGVAAGAISHEPIFGERGRRPVSGEFDGDGECHTFNLSFDDYSRMQTMVRRTSRLSPPSWAVNQNELRALLVRFFEVRAGMKPGTGSFIQRLNSAQQRILATIPNKVVILDRLCREYLAVRGTDPERARVLAVQIMNLDTVIRTAREGPGLICRLVYLAYAVGMDSVGVASELGIRPVSVRQTLYRLHRLAGRE